VVIALWIAHAHCIEHFNCTGYLHIYSPIKRCGKSKLLECLAMLAPRAWLAINPSDAVLFRKIERDCPTLLLDEADRSFADGENGNHDLLAILNAGYTRGATVDRCGGANRDKLESFHVFCPKAFAGIGKLPDTTQDRCFPIRLERQQARASKRLRRMHAEVEMFPIRDRLTDWAQSESAKHKLSVELLPSALPGSLSDRAADVSEPLFKVAIAAGGDWYERAVKATTAIFGSEEDENKQTAQLAAIRDAFGDAERLSTSDLIDRLLEQDDLPFPNWWLKDSNKKSIGKSLAGILKPFGIKKHQMRIDGAKVKGYERADFAPVWDRYCVRINNADDNSGILEVAEVPSDPSPVLQGTYAGTSNIGEAATGTSNHPF
jgi:hypothetical protein